MQLGIQWRWCGAILTLKNPFRFFGHVFIAATGQHINNRLRADNLRGWRYQGNEAKIFSYPGYLFEYFIKALGGTLLTQLIFQISQHTARHLSHQNTRVHTAQCAFEFGVLLSYLAEVTRNLFQQQQVQTTRPITALKNRHNTFCGWMAVGHAHTRYRGIHIINPGFNGLDAGCCGHASGRVALHVDGNRQRRLHPAHQLKRGVGVQQPGHVFNTDGVGPHVFNAFRQVNPQINGMHWADRVRNCALGMAVHLQNRFDGRFQITHIVHGIEHPKHIHAIHSTALDKLGDHIIGIVAVTQNVLPAKQHLLWGFWHRSLKRTNTLPGVFSQIANAGIKGCPTPGF